MNRDRLLGVAATLYPAVVAAATRGHTTAGPRVIVNPQDVYIRSSIALAERFIEICDAHCDALEKKDGPF